MMTKYNVLWIEDEPQKQDSFLDEAALEGIDLHLFKTNKLGMDELETHINFYDAVILDAKGYEKSEDERASLTGLQNSIKAINALSKKIPYFIYSGYLDKIEYGIAREMLNNEEIFTKGKDNQQLLTRIKEKADRQIDTQIRHKYQRIFEVCTNKYIGEDANNTLLSLLRSIEDNENNLDSNDKLNTIRKIVEKLFVALNRIGILPDELRGNINGSSKFLAGVDSSYSLNEEIADKTTAYLLRSILTVTQDGSHIGSSSSLGVNNHIVQRATPYLFSSVLFQLLDVLLWFKEFADKHQDIEKNKLIATLSTTSNSSIYEGVIAQDSNNNYYCGEHLLNYRFVSKNYQVGDRIKITGESENTNPKTNTYYSKYATFFTNPPQ
jgi:hypothetical protein